MIINRVHSAKVFVDSSPTLADHAVAAAVPHDARLVLDADRARPGQETVEIRS